MPLDVTAKPYREAELPRQLPRIAVAQPLISDLDLPAVMDGLLEDAVLVANPVTDRRDLQRGEGVHVTRSQASQTAVSKARLLLGLEDRLQIQAQR